MFNFDWFFQNAYKNKISLNEDTLKKCLYNLNKEYDDI